MVVSSVELGMTVKTDLGMQSLLLKLSWKYLLANEQKSCRGAGNSRLCQEYCQSKGQT